MISISDYEENHLLEIIYYSGAKAYYIKKRAEWYP